MLSLESPPRHHRRSCLVVPAAGGPPFAVRCSSQEDALTPGQVSPAVVRVSGEVDAATSPRLAQALAEALRGGPPTLVVDLAHVDFVDVTGIRVLATAAGRARAAGASLVLRSPSRQVRRIIALLHPDGTLPIEPSGTAASASERSVLPRAVRVLPQSVLGYTVSGAGSATAMASISTSWPG